MNQIHLLLNFHLNLYPLVIAFSLFSYEQGLLRWLRW